MICDRSNPPFNIMAPLSVPAASSSTVGGRLPTSATFTLSTNLTEYPKLNDGDARKLYAAHSYLMDTVIDGGRGLDNDDSELTKLDNILGELEEGFDSTKAGKQTPPYEEDGYEAAAHIIEDNGTLTVLVRCRDGLLRAQGTSIVIPAALSSTSVNSPNFKRLNSVAVCRLSGKFFAQLNHYVDAYFLGVVNGMKVRSTAKDKDFIVPLSPNNNKTKRRSRHSPRLIRVLGHCPPNDFITYGTTDIAVLYFQTDMGIGMISAEAPRTGSYGYKCQAATPLPTNPISSAAWVKTPTENTHETDVETAKKSLARSRIEHIVVLLSRMRGDDDFVDECCKLTGFADKNELVAMSLVRLRTELENFN